jgi:hypothetical protein
MKKTVKILHPIIDGLPEIHVTIGDITLVADLRPSSMRRMEQAGFKFVADGELVGSMREVSIQKSPKIND